MKGVLTVALAVLACSSATVARGADAPPAPGALVVALGLGDPMLQAGAVRGRDVIVARGFEVELARILARRLGGRVERFVYVPSTVRLLASGTSGWHLAFAGIERSSAPRRAALTASYLTSDVAVVTRRGLAAPRRLVELRRVLLCAVRGGDGARVASAVVRPTRGACSSSSGPSGCGPCCAPVPAMPRSCRRSRRAASSTVSVGCSARSPVGSGTATVSPLSSRRARALPSNR